MQFSIFSLTGVVAFVDTEGNYDQNGRVPDERFSGVVEFSMILVEWLTLRVLHVFHSFVKPLGPVPFFVKRNIHGLTHRFLIAKPSWHVVSQNLIECIKRFRVAAVIGVGREIPDLIANLPARSS